MQGKITVPFSASSLYAFPGQTAFPGAILYNKVAYIAFRSNLQSYNLSVLHFFEYLTNFFIFILSFTYKLFNILF